LVIREIETGDLYPAGTRAGFFGAPGMGIDLEVEVLL
jgi:hypothetical protein